jgi:hypothetical protein
MDTPNDEENPQDYTVDLAEAEAPFEEQLS